MYYFTHKNKKKHPFTVTPLATQNSFKIVNEVSSNFQSSVTIEDFYLMIVEKSKVAKCPSYGMNSKNKQFLITNSKIKIVLLSWQPWEKILFAKDE